MKALFKKTLAGLAISAAMATGAHAALLSGLLLDGGSLTVGDKLFDNWAVTFYDSSDVTRTFDPDNIEVTGIDDGGDYGLRFNVNNGELSVTGDDSYAYVDLTLSFRASVLPGAGMLIKDNSLALTDARLTHPSADHDLGIFIKEYIDSTGPIDPQVGGADLGEKEVEFSRVDLNGDGVPDANELTTDLNDSAAFAPQGEVWVTKNILVWASNDDDIATLTRFEQRFSQTPMPEPGSMALVALALAGLGFMRRRAR